MRIAVLDDDLAQADFVARTLRMAGHTCYVFSEGRALVRQLKRQTYDLLVLDWNLPGLSGEEVLRWVRMNLADRVPVLFMTSRDAEADITSILDLGADDYVVKPSSAGILIARVGSLLRRAYQIDTAAAKEAFGEFEFDRISTQVVVKGVVVNLTQKEFDLGLLLFRHLSRPLSRNYIRETVWKQETEIPSRTMDTHVSMLRVKLGLRPENGYVLTPIYGYGYRLEPVEQEDA
jgi:DNA-binding response OmpR family regulator